MSEINSITAISPLSSMTSEYGVATLSMLTNRVYNALLSGSMQEPALNAVSTHIGWFNVKDDFGAVGDGTRDDTESIVSPGSTITSVSITSASGGSMTTGLKPGPDGVMLQLGVGESIALSGSSIGSSSWKWFRS